MKWLLIILLFVVTGSSAEARSRVAYKTIGDVFNKKYHECLAATGKSAKECSCIYMNVYNDIDFSYEVTTFENDGEWQKFKGIWIDEKPISVPKDVDDYISEQESIYTKRCQGIYKYSPFIESPTWQMR